MLGAINQVICLPFSSYNEITKSGLHFQEKTIFDRSLPLDKEFLEGRVYILFPFGHQSKTWLAHSGPSINPCQANHISTCAHSKAVQKLNQLRQEKWIIKDYTIIDKLKTNSLFVRLTTFGRHLSVSIKSCLLSLNKAPGLWSHQSPVQTAYCLPQSLSPKWRSSKITTRERFLYCCFTSQVTCVSLQKITLLVNVNKNQPAASNSPRFFSQPHPKQKVQRQSL